jgi:hypothetical protein
MSVNKLLPNILAQKIIDLINNLPNDKKLLKEDLLDIVPELYNFIALSDCILTTYREACLLSFNQDNSFALNIRKTYPSLYENLTGVSIQEALDECNLEDKENEITFTELFNYV